MLLFIKLIRNFSKIIIKLICNLKWFVLIKCIKLVAAVLNVLQIAKIAFNLITVLLVRRILFKSTTIANFLKNHKLTVIQIVPYVTLNNV